MYINHSRIKTYQNCPRKYYWLYEHDGSGLEFLSINENLLIGTIIHAGLAWLYQYGEYLGVAAAMKESLEKEYPNRDPLERTKWDATLKWCNNLMADYHRNQFPKDQFTVLNTEVPFAVPLANSPHTYVGRIDMIVNDQGVIRIYDHKTTGSSSKLYLESWHYSNQMVGYTYGASKASGHNVRGYVVNILRKLKSVGDKRKESKTCPECSNGSKKKLSCSGCSGLGKIPLSREELIKQNPFQREGESVGEEDVKRWEHSRVQVVESIELNQLAFREASEVKAFRVKNDYKITSKNIEPGTVLLPKVKELTPVMSKEQSFPKNEENCFSYGRCPFLRLCYETDPETWWNPSMELFADFEPRDPDYVNDIERMQREELR